MCAILIIKSGLSREVVEAGARTAFKHNPHGIGYSLASIPDSPGVVRRTLVPDDAFFARLADEVSGHGGVVHARIASSGEVSEEGLHPFECGGGRVLYMNGTLSLASDSLEKLGAANDAQCAAMLVSSLPDAEATGLLDKFSARFVLHNLRTGEIFTTGKGWHDKNTCGCGAYQIKFAMSSAKTGNTAPGTVAATEELAEDYGEFAELGYTYGF